MARRPLTIAAIVVLLLALLVAAAWWQQRMMLCQDALVRRRAESGAFTGVRAARDVDRYCFIWVGR